MTRDSLDKSAQGATEKAARRAKNAANRARREANAAARAQAKKDANAPGLGKTSPQPGENNPDSGENPPAAPQQSAKISQKLPRADITDNKPRPSFNILIIAQAGKLERESVLFVESLRTNAPGWGGRLIVAEPRPEAAWSGVETALSPRTRAILEARGAEVTPFTARHFGAAYPQGNKIEAMALLPEGENFVFFDTDTLITGPLDRVQFDFARPSASMRREGTWPEPPPYGPGFGAIWKSLYDRFGLDYASSLDPAQPDEHWERYLYFNAGWFFGADPAAFGQRFLDWAVAIRNEPGDALACQSLEPWLDQVVLPLVIHSFGGGRPDATLAGLDGEISCHWHNLPLLYARESDAAIEVMERAANAPDIRELLEKWEPAARLIYQQQGRRSLRPSVDRDHLPLRERALRQQIKRAGWWLVQDAPGRPSRRKPEAPPRP